MGDQWDFYRAALRGEPVVIRDGVVESGLYWAKASRAGGRIPVAVWRNDGVFHCRVGARSHAKMLDETQAADRWTWFAGNPISRNDYAKAYADGVWPDGTPTTAPAPPAGSNLPTDPFDRLKAEVDDAIERALAFLDREVAPLTKVHADMARNMQAQLLALCKDADNQHKAEKQPHLDAGRAVDEKFRFRDGVKGLADRLRKVFESWMRAEELRQRDEAERKFRAEQDRVAAERMRIAAERERQMRDDPIAALTSDEPEMPEMPAAPTTVKVNAGGGVGRAAGLKSEWVGTITDYRACLAHFAEHDDVRAALTKLVARAVKAGKGATAIPGVVVKEERRAA